MLFITNRPQEDTMSTYDDQRGEHETEDERADRIDAEAFAAAVEAGRCRSCDTVEVTRVVDWADEEACHVCGGVPDDDGSRYREQVAHQAWLATERATECRAAALAAVGSMAAWLRQEVEVSGSRANAMLATAEERHENPREAALSALTYANGYLLQVLAVAAGGLDEIAAGLGVAQ